MENKRIRNCISMLIIMVMVMTAFAVPVLSGDTYAAGKQQVEKIGVSDVNKSLGATDMKRGYPDGGSADEGSINSLAVQADAAKCTAVIPEVIINNQQFIVQVIGDNQAATTAVNGDTKYLPAEYSVTRPGYSSLSGTFYDSNYDFYKPPYNITLLLYYMGTSTLTVTYAKMEFNGTKWVDIGEDYTATYNLDVKGYVNFNANKGKFKTSSAAKLVTYGMAYGDLPKMKTRKGYTFAGWYTDKTAGTQIKSSSAYNLTSNSTLYAQWKYKVKLSGNKGKVSGKKTKTKTITSGKKYGKLTSAKRSGYNFAGWFTKKSGGKYINKSAYVSNPSKHTLYAHWVKKSKYATKAQYNAVKKNMTYGDCKQIFGKKGVKQIRQGYTFYIWLQKGNRSGALVMYDNGVAVAKGWVSKSGKETIKVLNNDSSDWAYEMDKLIESVK